MSYKVDNIFLFDKQAKRLIKIILRLKTILLYLLKNLLINLNRVPPSVIIFIKYGCLLQLKARAKVEVPADRSMPIRSVKV